MPDRPPPSDGDGDPDDHLDVDDDVDVVAPTQDPDARQEMDATPPFFTWRTIYIIVLGGLAAQIALYAVLTAYFRAR